MASSQLSGAAPGGATLAPRASAPRDARALVRSYCARAGVGPDIAEKAAQALGELVLNHIRAGRRPVTVGIEVLGDEVTVSARGADQQRIRLVDAASPGAARSWAVVQRLANSWGYVFGESGTEIWASFRVTVPATGRAA